MSITSHAGARCKHLNPNKTATNDTRIIVVVFYDGLSQTQVDTNATTPLRRASLFKLIGTPSTTTTTTTTEKLSTMLTDIYLISIIEPVPVPPISPGFIRVVAACVMHVVFESTCRGIYTHTHHPHDAHRTHARSARTSHSREHNMTFIFASLERVNARVRLRCAMFGIFQMVSSAARCHDIERRPQARPHT